MTTKSKALLIALTLTAIVLPLAAQSNVREFDVAAFSQDAFQLTPSEQTVSRPLVIDTTSAFTVKVWAASQTLTVGVTGPDGSHYTVGDAATAQAETAFLPIDAPKPGGCYLITVNNPRAGRWTLQVSESSALTAPLDIITMTFLDNSRWLVLAGGGQDYPAGSDVRLALTAFDGTAKVRALTIDARMFRPFDPTFAPIAVTFRDDGAGADEHAADGIFEAFVNPGAPGTYQVQVDASAIVGASEFRRTAATQIRVVPTNAQIIGFSDRGVDDDADGLFDRIGVTPSANITDAGTYLVYVRLHASNGAELFHTVQQTFDIGTASPELFFSADEIKKTFAVAGPYEVAEVRYLQMSAGDFLPADIRYHLGSTAAYTIGQLQHPPVRLNGMNSAIGYDWDDNGLFNYLEITIGLDVDVPGWYIYSANLEDQSGHQLGFFDYWLYFEEPGPHEIFLDFQGEPMGAGNIDGPYVLKNLILAADTFTLMERDPYTTPPFTASQFEGYVPPVNPDTTPPVVSVGVSPSVLYPPNHKLVEITATVTATDDRDPHPAVSLASITSSQGDDWRGDGHTSPDIIVENGKIFLRAERTGVDVDRVYTITFAARDAAGNEATASATVTVPHDQRK